MNLARKLARQRDRDARTDARDGQRGIDRYNASVRAEHHAALERHQAAIGAAHAAAIAAGEIPADAPPPSWNQLALPGRLVTEGPITGKAFRDWARHRMGGKKSKRARRLGSL